MGLGRSSESALYVGKTTTEGTEPTTYDPYKFISSELSGQSQSIQEESIDPSGKGQDSTRVRKSGQGGITTHFFPGMLDNGIEAILRGPFGTAFTQTLTISFAAVASGLQTLTDDGATGVLGGLSAGDVILIGGDVADPENEGIRRVVSSTTDSVTVYNPTGVVSAADLGVTIDHGGVATLGSTGIWLWAERVDSDGSNLIYSEFFHDLLPLSWQLDFQASQFARNVFQVQGDFPIRLRADGAPPITKQRGGTDNAVVTDRLVHGMADVREIVLYRSSDSSAVVLKNRINQLQFTVNRQIVEADAIGTPDIIAAAVSRPTVSGSINAWLDAEANSTGKLQDYEDSNPDDLSMHLVFGSSAALSYGVFFNTVRIQNAPAPVSGNNNFISINAEFSATDVRVTRL